MKKLIIGIALLGSLGCWAPSGRRSPQAKPAGGGAAAAAGGGEETTSTKPRPSTTSRTTRSRAICSAPTASSSARRRRRSIRSLIEIRKDFIPEMLKSLEDV